ncbi:MAG: nucleotide exchange factor GrpE [bacterium]
MDKTQDKSDQSDLKADQPIESEITKLKAKAEEYLGGWKRAKADYLNLKKQSDKEKQELVGLASAAVIMELLPYKTSLDRAWRNLPEDLKDNNWITGLEQVNKQFNNILETMGITQFNPEGEQFNPEEHEAVKKVAQIGVKENSIIKVTEPGYKIRGKVIRPALVEVAVKSEN